MNTANLVGSWGKILRPVFNDREVLSNLNFVNKLYSKPGLIVYPEQYNVFRAFLECPYERLSIIILLQDPYSDGSATGIAMGNNTDKKHLSPSLRIVKDTIARTVYNYHDFDFDPTLKKWANQGILLLNTALTVEAGVPLSHQKLWHKFTKLTFEQLSTYNCGIIYCLWGKHASAFLPYINQHTNTILRCTHPVYASYRGIDWECDHFVKINKQLKEFNNTTINW